MEADGLVVQNTGSLYKVRVGKDDFSCKIKGAFKTKGIRTTNPIAVGDYVHFTINLRDGEGEEKEALGWIDTIHPRRNYIIRRSSNLSKEAHIIGANIDRALLFTTISYPLTSTTFIDRFLATAEAYGVEVIILFNKVDRYSSQEYAQMLLLKEMYQKIGYSSYAIVATKPETLVPLQEVLSHGISLLSGHSGVGKSTFINSLIPEACLRTASISASHSTGMHTTTYSRMIPFGEEAYLIDTPGIKGFGTIEFDPKEVSHYFPEIFKASRGCRFSDCTHTHEPGCAVIEGIQSGIISESRYKSYLSIFYDENDKHRASQ